MHRLLFISEQHQYQRLDNLSDYLRAVLSEEIYQKSFFYRPDMLCFRLYNDGTNLFADTNYFIGVDWLVPEKAAVYIEPKLNAISQIDFTQMLLQSLEGTENVNHLDNLFHVDYSQTWITIPTQKDLLSPTLIVQFLMLAQKIVRKGLRRSYYRVTENLNNRVKGKILIGEQIKHNILKNRLTKTICSYQEYGINTPENQFLKLILQFAGSYMDQRNSFFTSEQLFKLKNILHFCLTAFEQVSVLENKHQRIKVSPNPFYKEYNKAIEIGEYILKRFSFNISKTNQTQTSTPPFWIDMSKLFELFVFGKFKKIFPRPGEITYHDAFMGGKETDILIKSDGYKCVVDCKYKPQYQSSSPSLDDKRQLAGYTRLKSVYNKLSIPLDQVVRGLIVYPNQNASIVIEKESLFKTNIEEYVSFYKLGIKLPELSKFAG